MRSADDVLEYYGGADMLPDDGIGEDIIIGAADDNVDVVFDTMVNYGNNKVDVIAPKNKKTPSGFLSAGASTAEQELRKIFNELQEKREAFRATTGGFEYTGGDDTDSDFSDELEDPMYDYGPIIDDGKYGGYDISGLIDGGCDACGGSDHGDVLGGGEYTLADELTIGGDHPDPAVHGGDHGGDHSDRAEYALGADEYAAESFALDGDIDINS